VQDKQALESDKVLLCNHDAPPTGSNGGLDARHDRRVGGSRAREVDLLRCVDRLLVDPSGDDAVM
jgi:hypothetical protein